MYRKGGVLCLCLAAILVLAFGAAGCGPAEEEQRAAAREEAWADLEQRHEALLEKRQELRELRRTIAEAPDSSEPAEADEGEEGEEGMSPEAPESLEPRAAALEEEIVVEADAFQADLVNFINEDPMIQGEEPSERQLAALRMKSTEDVELAREYVDKGGDYRRAVDILERASGVDPDNEALQAYLEEIHEMRYVTEERFAEVEKGMSQNEVRNILGQVFHRNVREYQEQDALAWFYPKEDGGAAGVFFRERSGEWKVYQLDFDAVQPGGAASDS